MRRTLPIVAFLAASFLHCDAGDDGPKAELADCEGALPPSVVYPGDHPASEDALVRVWEARCRATTRNGHVLVAPQEGATVPAETPVTLSWEKASVQGGILGLRVGVSRALAHGSITGEVYLVELAPAGGGEALYVFTEERTWTPGAQDWARLVSMGEVRVTIWNAHLEKNVILDPSDGPFVSPRVGHFTIVEAP